MAEITKYKICPERDRTSFLAISLESWKESGAEYLGCEKSNTISNKKGFSIRHNATFHTRTGGLNG